jgi:ADP-heptose:LPS heptosyltransferase
MGIGDWLMASGEARALYKATRRPVYIVDVRNRPVWSEVFEGVPYIVKNPRGMPGHVNRLVNGGGIRPYIAGKTATKWTWRPYKPKPAQMVFTAAELAFAEPYRGMVMIEHNVKNVGHDNKAWSYSRWVDLVDKIADEGHRIVHCAAGATTDVGAVVHQVHTPTFRHAAAVLSVCKAFVGTDGGLMHAAAAVGTKSVILWSEFTSPDICGYASMVNLRHAGKACGNRLNCRGCREAMSKITVNEVVTALKGIL